jgi:hypothetical protein
MNATLHHIFAYLDGLPALMLGDRATIRALLEKELEEAGAYMTPQVDDYLEMLLDEYCAVSSRAA